MKLFLKRMTVAAILAMATLPALFFAGAAQADTYHSPASWMASLSFDGRDNNDRGEGCFPVRSSSGCLINSYAAYCGYNGYSAVDVEDASETYIPYYIGSSASGRSYENNWISSLHPSNQRPAVYWRQRDLSAFACPSCGRRHSGWHAYEYWLYYAVNPTDYWLYPQHDQDWEKYYVYFWYGQPVAVRLSNHHAFLSFDWAQFELDGLIEANTHLKLSIEGEGGKCGSHAFVYDKNNQDGVRIRYDGYITARNGTLVYGNGTVQPWTVFSNDPYANGVTSYTLAPQTYYKGDPEITGSGEYSDGMPAPWQRADWNSPPGPYCLWGL